MASVRITDDNALIFYMELRRKDSCVTAYALPVELVKLSNQYTDDLDRELERLLLHYQFKI